MWPVDNFQKPDMNTPESGSEPRVRDAVGANWNIPATPPRLFAASEAQGGAGGRSATWLRSLLRVFGARQPIDEKELRDGIEIGDKRTFEQDPKHAIRPLVDIAIKALSPAINDPTTAVQALDQIEDLLLRLGPASLGNWRVSR
jgi:hypothetical protein